MDDLKLDVLGGKDGDNIVVKNPETKEVSDVRLEGVSAEETNVVGRNTYRGVVAKDMMALQADTDKVDVDVSKTGKFGRPVGSIMKDIDGEQIDVGLVSVVLGYADYHRQYGHSNPTKDKLLRQYEAQMPDDAIPEIDPELFEVIGQKRDELLDAFTDGDKETARRLTKELFADPMTMVKYQNQVQRNLLESEQILPAGLKGAAVLSQSLDPELQGSTYDATGIRTRTKAPSYTALQKLGMSFQSFSPTNRLSQMANQNIIRNKAFNDPTISDAVLVEGIDVPHLRKLVIEERANYGSDAAGMLADRMRDDIEFRSLEENMSWYASLGYSLPAYIFDPTAIATGSLAAATAGRVGAGALSAATTSLGTKAAIKAGQWTLGGAIDAALVDAPRLMADETYNTEEYLTDVAFGTVLAGGIGGGVSLYQKGGAEKVKAREAAHEIEVARRTSQIQEDLDKTFAEIDKATDKQIEGAEWQHGRDNEKLDAKRDKKLQGNLAGGQGKRLAKNIAFVYKKHSPKFAELADHIAKMHDTDGLTPQERELLGKVTADIAEIARAYPNGAVSPKIEKNVSYYLNGHDEAGYEHIIGNREVSTQQVSDYTNHITGLEIWGDANPHGDMSGRDFLVKWGATDVNTGTPSAEIDGAMSDTWVNDPEQMKQLLMENQFSNASNHAESESGAFINDIIKIVNEQYGKGDAKFDAELEKLLYAVDTRMTGKTKGDWDELPPSMVEDINPTTFEDFNNLIQQEYNSNYIRANQELRARMAAATAKNRKVQELAQKLAAAGHDPVEVINKHFDVAQHEDLINDINQARRDDAAIPTKRAGAQTKYVASNQKIGDRLDRNFGELIAMARSKGVKVYSDEYQAQLDSIKDSDIVDEIIDDAADMWAVMDEGGELPDTLPTVVEEALEARHNSRDDTRWGSKHKIRAIEERIKALDEAIVAAQTMVRKYNWGKHKQPARMEEFNAWTKELEDLRSKLDNTQDEGLEMLFEGVEARVQRRADEVYRIVLELDYKRNGARSYLGAAIERTKHKKLKQWVATDDNYKYSREFSDFKKENKIRTSTEVARFSKAETKGTTTGSLVDTEVHEVGGNPYSGDGGQGLELGDIDHQALWKMQSETGKSFEQLKYDAMQETSEGRNAGVDRSVRANTVQNVEFDASGSEFLPRSRVVASKSIKGSRLDSKADGLRGAHNFMRGKVIPKMHKATHASATRTAMTAAKRAEAEKLVDQGWANLPKKDFISQFIYKGSAMEYDVAVKKYNDWIDKAYVAKKNEFDAKLAERQAALENARDELKNKAQSEAESKIKDLSPVEKIEQEISALEAQEPELPVKLDEGSLETMIDHAEGKEPDSAVEEISKAMEVAQKAMVEEDWQKVDELLEDFVATKDKVGETVRENESWLSKVLGTGTRSIGEQLFKSKIPSLRYVGTMFTELSYGYGGIATRGKTAATIKSVNYHRTMAKFSQFYDEAFDEWVVEQGSNTFLNKTEKYTPEAASATKKKFNDQFASYMNDKRLGRKTKESAAMDKLFKHWTDGMDHVHDMQVKAGVKGFDATNKRKNYMPQIWKKGAIDRYVQDYGKKALVDMIYRAMDNPSETGALNILEHITRQMDEAEMYTPSTDARAKSRADLDWSVQDANGNSLMDLLDTDVPILYNKYANRASGQAAISSVSGGVLNSPSAIETFRGRIKVEALAVGDDPDEAQELFDQIVAELHGRPPAGDTPEWLRAIKESTVLNFMGKLGTAQLAESGIGLTKVLRSGDMMGLEAAFKANPELAGELAHFTGLSDEMHRFQTYSNYLDEEDVSKISKVREVMGMAANMATGGERVRSTAQRALGALSGFNSVRAAQHRMVQVSTAVEIIKNLRGSASAITSERMLDLGISPEVGNQILRQVNDHANFDSNGKLTKLNLDKWDTDVSDELAYALERGAAQDVQRTLVGEKPAYLNNPYIAAIAQFKEFSIIAQSKALRRGLNFADTEAAVGIILNAVTANIARVGALSAVGGFAALTTDEEFDFEGIQRKANAQNYISGLGVGADLFSLANWAQNGNKELTMKNMGEIAKNVPAISLMEGYADMADPSLEKAIAISPLHTLHLVEALTHPAEDALRDTNYRK